MRNRLLSGLAALCVSVKANEALPAAREARVRFKSEGELPRAMAGQGEQHMTQEQLNAALREACGRANDLARVEELMGRGAI